ncbi:hypothetical protein [Rugamonas sp.]|uniref:hypothetical protein n=1 Tax=Rugamonas sp. TaxID=1926287 RepID=UPI0025D984C9|nr:hypothetical protein [Rugamonas sp.]
MKISDWSVCTWLSPRFSLLMLVIIMLGTIDISHVSAIEKIKQGVSSLDDVTQQNAALVEKAAAQAMQAQSLKSAAVISIFQLDPDSSEVRSAVQLLRQLRGVPVRALRTKIKLERAVQVYAHGGDHGAQ